MATGAVSRLSKRIASLARRFSQVDLQPQWRRRLRWVKLIGIMLLLLSPAIVALAEQLVTLLGPVRSLEITIGSVALAAIVIGSRIGIRALKQRKEARFDRNSAQAIQRLILPQALPVCRGFGLAAVCRTYREVGGDYYDAICLDHDQILLALGDVSGKGMPAALVTSGIHAIVRTQAHESRRLPNIARMLAGYLSQHTGRYATLVIGILDAPGYRFTYINAGHNPPLLLRDDGTLELLNADGPPLGLLPDIQYAEETVALLPGDRLLFYTDGLTDRPNRAGDNYGDLRLAAALRACAHASPSHMTELILRDNDHFAQPTPQDDDISMVVVKCYKH